MMSRKHYVAIAAILRNARMLAEAHEMTRDESIDSITEALAAYLETDNASFDRGRFLEAARSPE